MLAPHTTIDPRHGRLARDFQEFQMMPITTDIDPGRSPDATKNRQEVFFLLKQYRLLPVPDVHDE